MSPPTDPSTLDDGVRGGYRCTFPGCDFDAVVDVLVTDHERGCEWRPRDDEGGGDDAPTVD